MIFNILSLVVSNSAINEAQQFATREMIWEALVLEWTTTTL